MSYESRERFEMNYESLEMIIGNDSMGSNYNCESGYCHVNHDDVNSVF